MARLGEEKSAPQKVAADSNRINEVVIGEGWHLSNNFLLSSVYFVLPLTNLHNNSGMVSFASILTVFVQGAVPLFNQTKVN